MRKVSPGVDLAEWKARLEIRATINNYALGLDTRDMARFLSAWHDDAVLEIDQPRSVYIGHEELAGFAESSWEEIRVHNHFIANHIVEVSEETATGICQAAAMLVYADDMYVTAAARYDDTYQRRDGTWRTSRRRVRLNHWAKHPGVVR